MNILITAVLLLTAISFTASANKQCGEEEKKIIEMQERSLNQGTVRRSSLMAYARIAVGSSGIIYAVVNSATGIGLLSFVIFIGGSLDIYINSETDESLDKLKEKLCT